MSAKQNQRRINAKQRLEEQLKRGKKPLLVVTDNGSSVWQNVALEEKDINRIKKEIEILKARIS